LKYKWKLAGGEMLERVFGQGWGLDSGKAGRVMMLGRGRVTVVGKEWGV